MNRTGCCIWNRISLICILLAVLLAGCAVPPPEQAQSEPHVTAVQAAATASSQTGLTQRDMLGIEEMPSEIHDIAVSPKGDLIASSHFNGSVRISNLDGERIQTWNVNGENLKSGDPPLQDKWIASLAFSPDGKMLALSCFARIGGVCPIPLLLWRFTSEEQPARMPGFVQASQINDIAFHPDGNLLALADNSESGAVRIWDISHQRQVWAKLEMRCGWVGTESVSFSSDGKLLAVGACDTSPVYVFDVEGDAIRERLQLHASGQVAFSPDGKALAVGEHDGTLRLWDLSTGEPGVVMETRKTVRSLSFHPDGTLLAASNDTGVSVWDAANGDMLSNFDVPTFSLAFSSDGKILATGGLDGLVRLWGVPADGESFP